jgi:hypothetical protein
MVLLDFDPAMIAKLLSSIWQSLREVGMFALEIFTLSHSVQIMEIGLQNLLATYLVCLFSLHVFNGFCLFVVPVHPPPPPASTWYSAQHPPRNRQNWPAVGWSDAGFATYEYKWIVSWYFFLLFFLRTSRLGRYFINNMYICTWIRITELITDCLVGINTVRSESFPWYTFQQYWLLNKIRTNRIVILSDRQLVQCGDVICPPPPSLNPFPRGHLGYLAELTVSAKGEVLLDQQGDVVIRG